MEEEAGGSRLAEALFLPPDEANPSLPRRFPQFSRVLDSSEEQGLTLYIANIFVEGEIGSGNVAPYGSSVVEAVLVRTE